MEVHYNPNITARLRGKFCKRARLFDFPYEVRQRVAKFRTEESVQARRAYGNDRSHVLAMVTHMRQKPHKCMSPPLQDDDTTGGVWYSFP